jgi:hypothetical protein
LAVDLGVSGLFLPKNKFKYWSPGKGRFGFAGGLRAYIRAGLLFFHSYMDRDVISFTVTARRCKELSGTGD